MDLAVVNKNIAITALGCCTNKIICSGGNMPSGTPIGDTFVITGQSGNTFTVAGDQENVTTASTFNSFLNTQLGLGTTYVGVFGGANDGSVFQLSSSTYSSGNTTLTFTTTPAAGYSGSCLYFTKIYNSSTDSLVVWYDPTGALISSMSMPANMTWGAGSLNCCAITLTGSGTCTFKGTNGSLDYGGGSFWPGSFTCSSGQTFVFAAGSQNLDTGSFGWGGGSDFWNYSGWQVSFVTGCTVQMYSGTAGEIIRGIIGDVSHPVQNYVALGLVTMFPATN